jgi:hypothetical protein
MKTGDVTLAKALKLDQPERKKELAEQLGHHPDKAAVHLSIPWVELQDTLAEQVVQLLGSKFGDLCLSGWKKCRELQEYADLEKHPAGELHKVPLVEHQIDVEQHPALELVSGGAVLFRLDLGIHACLTVKGCTLSIDGGMIKSVLLGSCQVDARVESKGYPLLEAKSEPLELGEIPLEPGMAIHP